MDQLFALFDTYRWLGSAFGVLVLTAIVRYLATRMLKPKPCGRAHGQFLGRRINNGD